MLRRSTVAILLGSMLVFSQMGCIGQMALSGKVMKFNLETVEGKWGREGLFLLMYIIPVYPIAGFCDLLIVNSIEFHTGTNPITDKPRIALREGADDMVAPDGTHASAAQREDGSVDLTVTDTAGEQTQLRLVPVAGGVEAHDGEGNVLGRVDSDGTLHSETGPAPALPRG